MSRFDDLSEMNR